MLITEFSKTKHMILSHYHSFFVIQYLFDDQNEACPAQPALADLDSAGGLDSVISQDAF